MKTIRPILAASIAVFAVSAPRTEAVDRIWNPVSGLEWTTGANWSGGVAPGAGDIAVFNSSTFNPTYASPVYVDGLRIEPTAGSFFFNGAGMIELGASGIVHNSNSSNVTITSPLRLYGNTWSGTGSGALTIAGLVDLGYYNTTLMATHPVTVSSTGTLSFGASGKLGSGTVVVDGGALIGIVGLTGVGLTTKNGATITTANLNFEGYSGSVVSIEAGSTVAVSGAIHSDGNSPQYLSITGPGTSVTSGSLSVGAGQGSPFGFHVTVGPGATFVTGAVTDHSSAFPSGEINLTGGSFTAGNVTWYGKVNVSAGLGTFTSISVPGQYLGLNTMSVSGGTFTSATTSIGVNATCTVSGGVANLGSYTPSASAGLNTLVLTGGTTRVTGNYVVGDASLAHCLDAQLSLPSGATLEASGVVTVLAGTGNGALNLTGGTLRAPSVVRQSGAFTWDGGTLAITGAGGVSLGGGQLLGTNYTHALARTLQVTNALTVPAGTAFTLAGGRVEADTLVNQGTFVFQSGTLALTGINGLTVGTGGPLGNQVSLPFGTAVEVGANFLVQSGAQLFLGGTVTAGSGIWVGAPGVSWSVASGGRIILQNGTGRLAGAGVLTNGGLITGDGMVEKPVTNAAGGQLRAEAGKTLVFTGAMGANAGTFSLQGGTLEFTTAITNGATGFIGGHGALRTEGLTNQGSLAVSGGNADIFGDVTNSAGGRIVTSGGVTTTFFDDVVHNGTEIRTSAGCSTVFLGAVSGAGPYTGTGTVYFEGDLRPGNSPASVLYEGDLVLGGAATLTLEIGGLTVGAQYDHVSVGGTLAEDGTLDVVLYGGFTPQAGATFDLLDAGAVTGSFDAVNLPALGGGLTWDTSQFAASGIVGVVPEPATGTLLLGGLALLGFRRRIRQ